MKYQDVLHVCLKTCPQVADEKIRILAKEWSDGDRNISRLTRKSRIAHNTMEKLKKALRAAESAELARAAELEELAAAQGEHAVLPDSIIAPPPIQTREAPDGTTLISGPLFVSWIDELLEDAKESKNIRNLKLLADMRSSIINFASEMPVTHVDIERTLGLEGLAGMDSVLVDTLVLFFEDIDHYPRCKRFLSETFSVDDAFWQRKTQNFDASNAYNENSRPPRKAANPPVITAGSPRAETPEKTD